MNRPSESVGTSAFYGFFMQRAVAQGCETSKVGHKGSLKSHDPMVQAWVTMLIGFDGLLMKC